MRRALLLSLSLFACSDPTEPPTVVDDGGVHDPLSMPAQPTLSPDSFNPSASCAACHPNHFTQWKSSTHAYAMVDPVFRALVKIRQDDYDGAQDQFCTQCHSAIGTRGGEITAGFSFEELSPITLEGIGCESCHKIAALERPYNSGHVIDPDGPVRATIDDPRGNAPHESMPASLFGTSEFCSGCHDVVEVSGLELERPFAEWIESPAAAAGTTCQDCHMRSTTGEAAEGAGERTVHDHRFIGVDVPLADGFASDEERVAIRSGVIELLDGCADLNLQTPTSVAPGAQLDVLVTVTNNISGHNLPTGTTFVREVWVELTATDDSGVVLYQTGDLDENGDLRHHFSELDRFGDNDLLLFNATLIDAEGQPVLFPWRAAELRSTAIPPGYPRTFTLFVPTTPETSGPIRIDARLRFRSHAPYLLRALGLPELVDKLEIHDIATTTGMVEVASP